MWRFDNLYARQQERVKAWGDNSWSSSEAYSCKNEDLFYMQKTKHSLLNSWTNSKNEI